MFLRELSIKVDSRKGVIMKLTDNVKCKAARFALGASAVGTALVPCVSAFASDATGSADVTSSLTSAFTQVKSDALSAIGKIVPIALPILGAFIVVTIGIKIFKKVSGKA